MRKDRFFFWVVLVASLTIYARSADYRFQIVRRPFEGYTLHLGYLTPYRFPMPDGKIQDWVRQRFPKMPGDYFRWPSGADTVKLAIEEFSEIESSLQKTVDGSFYDRFVLDNLTGYGYSLDKGKIYRKEYYVSYAVGDTIYVISGWFGKFLSFYEAVPGAFRLSIEEFQARIKVLSPSYQIAKEGDFKEIDDKNNYLFEYIDKKNMTRVRNYLVDATFIPDNSTDAHVQKYNLIEITKFIDPEVMP